MLDRISLVLETRRLITAISACPWDSLTMDTSYPHNFIISGMKRTVFMEKDMGTLDYLEWKASRSRKGSSKLLLWSNKWELVLDFLMSFRIHQMSHHPERRPAEYNNDRKIVWDLFLFGILLSDFWRLLSIVVACCQGRYKKCCFVFCVREWREFDNKDIIGNCF